MKTLKIKQLTIKNIKGISDAFYDFTTSRHWILKGYNGTGKTTMLDTLSWLLTGGKDIYNGMFDPQSKTISLNEAQNAKLKISVDDKEYLLEISRPNQQNGTPLIYLIDNVPVGKVAYVNQLTTLGISKFPLLGNPWYLLSSLTDAQAREEFMKLVNRPTKEFIESKLLEKNYTMKHISKLAYSSSWSREGILYETGKINTELSAKNILLSEYESKVKEIGLDYETKTLISRETELVNLIKTIEESNSPKVFELESQLKEAQKELENVRINYQEISNKLQEVIDNKRKGIETIEKTNKSLNNVLSKIEMMKNKVGSSCPVCFKPMEADEEGIILLENEAKVLVGSLEIADKNLKLIEQKLVQINPEHETIGQLVEIKERNVRIAQENLYKGKQNEELVLFQGELIEIRNKLSKVDSLLYITGLLESVKNEIKRLNSDLEFIKQVDIANTEAIAIENNWIKDTLSTHFKGIDLEVVRVQKNGIIKNCFTVSINGIDFKNLNTSSKLRAGIELCFGIQSIVNVSTPIILDQLEVLDEIIYPNCQVIGTEVIKKH